MLRQKRGVSPLIATVLLIAFAVALGAVVMNWGKSFAVSKMEDVQTKSNRDLGCTMDISLKLDTDRSGADQLCYGPGPSANTQYLYFVVVNEGAKDIYQIDLHILGAGDPGIYSNTSMNGTSISVGAPKKVNITYDNSTVGSITKVSIVPKVYVTGSVVACSANAIERDTIRAC